MATTRRGDTGHHHERLWSIAGRWATDGHVIADPPVPVTGFDTYEVLAGGYFLVHHVDVHVGDQSVRAIEIIGEPDPTSDGFLARSFDNTGSWEVMQVTVDDEACSASLAALTSRRQPTRRTEGRQASDRR
jgi:hypothetical protein